MLKERKKIIDDSLKKAIEKRIPKYNQNTSHSKDTTKAKKKKIILEGPIHKEQR